MEFTKPPLTFEEQADLLVSRGLIADRDQLINRLRSVNYYRMSGYLYNFRRPDDSYHPGTTLDTVWRHYTFDRRLRLLVMDALERVEVAVRTQLAYHFAHEYGPFAYTDRTKLAGLDEEKFQQWQTDLDNELGRSKERFLLHFRDKYGDHHQYPPVWMLVEVMSFGRTLSFYNGVDTRIRDRIAIGYKIPEVVLQSWLRALNTIRNICAHHGRLWNRELGVKPLLPGQNKFPEWYAPVPIPKNKMFGILTILNHLLRYAAPTSRWDERLRTLIADYQDIPLRWMGLPPDWLDSPLWK